MFSVFDHVRHHQLDCLGGWTLWWVLACLIALVAACLPVGFSGCLLACFLYAGLLACCFTE